MAEDLIVTEKSLKHTLELGQVFAMSGKFSDVQNKAQAVVKILAGRELGLKPITAMSQVFVVNNKVGIPGELMADLIKRSDKYDYRIKTSTAKACEIIFYEMVGNKKEDIGHSTFTIEEAAKILTTIKGVQKPLTTKDNWKNYPKDMLLWYTLKHGARIYCPDAIHGACLKDELQYVETTAEPGINDKIAAAKEKAGSEAIPPLNGDIVEEPPKSPKEEESAAEPPNQAVETAKKTATIDKLKELMSLKAKLPGETSEMKDKVYQVFKQALKIETPDEELTTTQANILIGIVKNNIPKGEEVVDAEMPPETPGGPADTSEPPAETSGKLEGECPEGCCVSCFVKSKGKKVKKLTAGALKLSKKQGKENHCFACLKEANK